MSAKTNQPQPAAVDAVAAALNVEISDADRASYQLERAPDDATAGEQAPAAGEQTPAPGQAPAGEQAPAAGEQAPAGGQAPADGAGKDGEPTEEEIEAILNGQTPAGETDTKTGDALLDEEIPADAKGRTRERMEQLLARGRESHAKIQEMTSELEELRPLAEQADGWQAVVVKSGLTPEDFATVMGTMAYINNGTVAEKRVAFDRIKTMYRDLAAQLGEGDDQGDILDHHLDLKGMVDKLEIPRAQAEELARARNREKLDAQDRANGDQATQLARARKAAETRLDQLGNELATRDGSAVFRVRKHIALRALQGQVASLHPNQWEDAFIRAYDATPKAVVDAAIAQLRGGGQASRRQTPIMGGGGGGGGGTSTGGGNGGQMTRKVETTQDAVFAALGITVP